MLSRELLLAEYQAAIVSAADPDVAEDLSWSDPALYAVMRHQTCVVLTAWNPGTARLSLEVNAASNALMRAQLDASGFEIWSAQSSAPDGQFHEPGFLVWSMPIELALAIATEFSQLAIYAYADDGDRTVIPCDAR